MILNLFWLVAGLVLIVKGGDLFVASSVRIGRFLRMPRLVIGSTLVSLATTSPELAVSITSGAVGDASLAIGNAVGSCICNIALILGTMATLGSIEVHARILRVPLVAMTSLAALLLLMTLDLRLARWQGVALIIAGLAYFSWDFWRNWRSASPERIAAAASVEQKITGEKGPWIETRLGTAAQFIAGALLVVIGSRLLVEGAVATASALGIPTIVLGLTVVAIGTSLPELVTAIVSSRKSVSDLAVGNVIGANIANLSFVVGAAAVMQDVSMSRTTQLLNFPVLLLLIGLLSWKLLATGQLCRRDGFWLVAFYLVYLGTLLWLTLA